MGKRLSLNYSAALLAAGLIAASGAEAATYNLGTLTPTGTASVASVVGSFTDYLNFDIAAPNTFVTGVLQDVELGFTFGKTTFSITNIDNLAVSLYKGTVTSASQLLSQTGNDFYAGGGFLNAGHYVLAVTGTGTGFGGLGLYAYGVKAQDITGGGPPPVPEPGEWAMMLAGLGMIGYIARRRTNSRI